MLRTLRKFNDRVPAVAKSHNQILANARRAREFAKKIADNRARLLAIDPAFLVKCLPGRVSVTYRSR